MNYKNLNYEIETNGDATLEYGRVFAELTYEL